MDDKQKQEYKKHLAQRNEAARRAYEESLSKTPAQKEKELAELQEADEGLLDVAGELAHKLRAGAEWSGKASYKGGKASYKGGKAGVKGAVKGLRRIPRP
jgi:hypothetical protein